MTAQPDEPSFSESHLDSPEYRQRLQRKLNCLIAVLEVASAKVRRSLTGPDADIERLTRIQKNLQDTLRVCQRAKRALDRREDLPAELPEALTETIEASKADRRPRGMEVEMTTPTELVKFASMGPIGSDEISNVNIDELTRLLQE
jgi:hypothetical protein